jgi:hypothetical protein
MVGWSVHDFNHESILSHSCCHKMLQSIYIYIMCIYSRDIFTIVGFCPNRTHFTLHICMIMYGYICIYTIYIIWLYIYITTKGFPVSRAMPSSAPPWPRHAAARHAGLSQSPRPLRRSEPPQKGQMPGRLCRNRCRNRWENVKRCDLRLW